MNLYQIFEKLSFNFRCEQSGQCINYEQICDKHVDCPDGSDEFGCHDEPYTNKRFCPNINEFACDEDKCLDDSKMCDGINDCLDFTDEIECALQHPQVRISTINRLIKGWKL